MKTHLVERYNVHRGYHINERVTDIAFVLQGSEKIMITLSDIEKSTRKIKVEI